MAVNEVQIGTAEAFRKAINDNFNALEESINNLKSEVGEDLQEDIVAVQNEIAALKTSVSNITTKVTKLEGGMKIYVGNGTKPPDSANMKTNDIWFRVI